MERRMSRTLATRFGILATDIGKLRWLNPANEPHMTRIVKGVIEPPEPTHELDLRDLTEVMDKKGPAQAEAGSPGTDPPAKAASPAATYDDDLMLDALAGAHVMPPEESAREPTHEIDIRDMMEVRGEGARKDQVAPQSPEPEEERDGPAPSVVASLADLKRISDEKKAEEARAASERQKAAEDARIAALMAREIDRFASPPAPLESGIAPEEAAPVQDDDSEPYIESGEFELPQLTDKVPPMRNGVIPLFIGPEEKKTARITNVCSAVYLDHDQENNHAFLRINHEASGAFETVTLGLTSGACPVFATDEGLLIGLKTFEGRIDAKVVDAPAQLVLPNFKSRFTPGEEIANVYWHPKMASLEAVDLGHGYFLGPGGSGFARDGSGLSVELYLSDGGDPKEYSRQFPYLRRFRLGEGEEHKTFMIGQVRVDITLNEAGAFITKKMIIRRRPILPKPSVLTQDQEVKGGEGAFDEAFAKVIGSEAKAPEKVLHGFEDVMGEAEQTPPAPARKDTGTDLLLFEELCRSVENSGMPKISGYFLERIADSDTRIRRLATRAFSVAAKNGRPIPSEAIAALSRALVDENQEVRENANDALFYAAQDGVPIDETIRMSLADPRRRDGQTSVMLSLKDISNMHGRNDPFGG